jgi:predicted transcriptional regulator
MKRKPGSKEDLVKLFGSVSRSRILSILYAFPGQSFYQREIMFETGLALRAIQRELGNLALLGIVKTQKTHNKVYYALDRGSAFFRPLGEILRSASQG